MKESAGKVLLYILSCVEAANSLAPLLLLQDANVFVSESQPGTSFSIDLGARRQAYLICIEGNLAVNDEEMTTRDAAEAVAHDTEPMQLQLKALQQGSHFMIIEMAKS